jgi:sporadic carbohydrate cluster protein (TIGR04323 family)
MSDAAEGRGYPGYVSSRPISGYRVPQHVQNLVIRDYAQRRGFLYKLSGTEYAIDHCYMMLEQLVSELPSHEGIIAYSMFMLPQRAERRLRIYQRILDVGCGLHAAVEDFVLDRQKDIARWEDVWQTHQLLAASPCPDLRPAS